MVHLSMALHKTNFLHAVLRRAHTKIVHTGATLCFHKPLKTRACFYIVQGLSGLAVVETEASPSLGCYKKTPAVQYYVILFELKGRPRGGLLLQ